MELKPLSHFKRGSQQPCTSQKSVAIAVAMSLSLIEEDMPLPLDSLAWHTPSTLLLGAYQLQEEPTPSGFPIQSRIGRLYLIQITPSVPGGFTVSSELETDGGVLDLKILGNSVVVATSEGIYFYEIQDLILVKIAAMKMGAMVLYLEWISVGVVCYSDAEGVVGVVEKKLGGVWGLGRKRKVHEALTWVIHFSASQKLIYCGADCGKFTAFALHDMMRDELMFNHRYSVGVTSINTVGQRVFVGGYDDTLRTYKLTSTNPKPQLQPLATINLGGAVWRTKFMQKSEKELTVVAACAKNGVKILSYMEEEDRFEVRMEFDKYKGKLAYGLDIRKVNEGLLVGSCYFDNHVVQCFLVEGF